MQRKAHVIVTIATSSVHFQTAPLISVILNLYTALGFTELR